MASVGRALLAGGLLLGATGLARAQIQPELGAGVGYNRFVTTVETSKEKFDGHVRLGYAGVQLYLTGAF
jgi:hypothetical protein